MKSRQDFEGSLDNIVKNRILQSKDSRDEALFLIDTFMAASFFLVSIIEKGASMERSMNCMFTRAQRVRELIEKAKRNPTKENGGADGDPIIIQP
jgi:hypothetical protein